MKFQDEILKQPFIYSTFSHALKENKLSHAYLIKGNEGSPLLETAFYLAKTLICEEPHPFACENCMSCIRFDEGNYADFMFLDGSKGNIKVSDIEALQNFFQKTASEKSGKMIYIIHLLENTNRESLNALLKFLEEPGENVYAFITTQNEDKLLPTILSRVQQLKLLPLKKSEIIEACTQKGISLDDAQLLSHYYGNIDTILSIAQSELYLKMKDAVFDVLNVLALSTGQALYFVESQLIPQIKDKVSARLFLDILSLAFQDIHSLQLNLDIVLVSQEQLLSQLSKKLNHVEQYYLEIMLSRGKIETNANLGLLLDHIFIQIHQGENR